MINTANMGIMANLVQASSSSMSTQMISQKDSDKDPSLNIEEMGVNDLVSQSELTTAIDSAMSEFGDQMPSNEDFQSMLSSFGFEAQNSSQNLTSSQEESISSILSEYDSSNLSQDDAQAIVAAFQKEGIEASDDLVSVMEEAGFDAQEVGTLAGLTAQGGTPPAGGGGGMSASAEEEEEYDDLDTNEDGVVSLEELQEAYGTSSTEETTSLTQNQQNALDNLSTLMDMVKSTSQNTENEVDTSSFDGLLKAINNQNNNGEINTYLQNTETSSLFSYA